MMITDMFFVEHLHFKDLVQQQPLLVGNCICNVVNVEAS